MSNILSNILVLVACWVLATGVGAYITFHQQPNELERVQKAEKVARMKQAEVETLLVEEAASKEMADDAVRRWNSRYKVIPAELHGYEVVAYLNDLTQSGFENFDIGFVEVRNMADYSYYSFTARGRAYYSSLYGFVRAIENNRNFYGIRSLKLDHIDLIKTDKETQRERMQVMVSFSMDIDAYFGATNGVSAPSDLLDQLAEENGLPVPTDGLPPVPAEVLPDAQPAVNPFFPVVMADLPPNTHGLVDMDEAVLVSIAGGKAVFNEEGNYRMLAEGDPVYLGQITEVNTKEGFVKARLNRGGIIDEVQIELATGDRYRQAMGPAQLAPVD